MIANADVQLANIVLNVLHDNNTHDDGVRSLLKNQIPNSKAQEFLVVKYDLSKKPVIELSGRFVKKTELVISHLKNSTSAAPWGMVDTEIVVLNLTDQSESRTGRLLLFSVDFVSDLLHRVFPAERITPAERTTLLQMLCGVVLKKAAQESNVSYETKKSQMRMLFHKTNTNSQQVLSSFLITHLILEISSVASRDMMNTETNEAFFYYVDNYMGSYVRASVIQQPGGNRIRVLELGDPAGYPVVCLHHLGLLSFSHEEIYEITEQNIRLICPLRHGALGPMDDRISPQQHMEHALAGIDLAVSLVGHKRVTIVTLLSGCLYGIKYLESYAEKVERIIFFAGPYGSQADQKSRSAVKNSLHQLAKNHEKVLNSTLTILLQNVNEPDRLRNVIRDSHNNGEADKYTIDTLFNDSTQVSAMQHRLSNSPLSIAQDLQAQANIDWNQLFNNDKNTNIHFIHGDLDELIPIETIEELMKEKPKYHLHRVAGAGNWIFGRFSNQTFSLVREICKN
ncbi:hypothetical protein N9850_06200 [Granulosicoccus sp.]|nr:hypothetical protein [Granulosicoccus sp.]MDB4223345.1 hypothetical protein [Granulosicoccus sp.]